MGGAVMATSAALAVGDGIAHGTELRCCAAVSAV